MYQISTTTYISILLMFFVFGLYYDEILTSSFLVGILMIVLTIILPALYVVQTTMEIWKTDNEIEEIVGKL